MLLRTSRLIAILFFTAMMFIAGVSANSDRQTQDAKRKKQSKPATKLAQQNLRRSPKPTNQPLFQPVQDKDRDNGIEDIKGRDDWFLFQRKYPFDAIPDDARKQAYESRPAELFAPDVASWQFIGPTPTTSFFPSNWGVTSGRINAVAISPTNSQIVLIGGATGGIWRSTNGGTSFSPTSDSQIDLAVQTIAFSASNSTIVYAGMGDTDAGYLGTGVLRSTDSGQTWTRINNSTLPSPGLSAKIEVDPTNSNRVYLAQYARLIGSGFFTSGFYLSTDGGVNWTKTLSGLPRDLVLNPANSQTLYLTMSRLDDGSLPGVYRSTNGGSTWARIYNSPYDLNATFDIAVAVTPANSQVIYVYAGGILNSLFETRVEVSTNGGSTWTNRGSGILDREQFGYNTYVYVAPANANTVYVGTRDLFKSTNGGVSWTNLTNNFNTLGQYTPTLSNTHPDQHSFAFVPGSSSTFYLGNDGGIWKTTNSGSSFSNFNSSLSLTMFVGYAIHPTNAAISYGGTQDNGSQKRLSTPGQWREFSTGDGGNCVVNVLSPSTVFSTYIFGSITRFINNGDTPDATVGSNTIFGESDTNPRIAFYPPFTGNGVNSNLYFGTWRLFISTNLGNSWTAPAGTFDLTKGITANGPDKVSAIGVSRSNTNVIYTGSAQGRAMVSTNGGTSWTDITAGLPNRFITAITVDPGNSAKAYLTVSGFATSHVFLTTNSGANWTNISGSLPDIPVNTLLIDPLNTNTLYVGTDIGVFQSTTGGNTWAGFNGGLPPVIVHKLVAQSSGLIQAATYGRGAFELMNGAITRTLTVASSNPASGVSITVSPNDNNGQGSGVTQFTRVYNDNTVVTLTAPSTAGGNNFQNWQRDGVDLTTSLLANFVMDANHTLTAVYVTPPPTTRTLTVASSNPASGVSVTVSPNDNNGQGNGVTPFNRVYNNNANVALTAPTSAGGNNFQKWQRDGLDFSFSQTTNVTMDANHTMTALYSGGGETLLLSETFSGGIPPTWGGIDGGSGGGAAASWTTANPGGRSMDTPFSGVFAIVDSDNAGVSATQDEQLITPVINATGCGQVILEFSNQFVWYDQGFNEIADVDVSTNGGATWLNVLRMQGANDGFPSPNTKSINITSVLGANRSNVKIRFHYYNASFEWWWAVDNVKVRCLNTTGSSPFDFDGDGRTDLAVWHPGDGTWYIINSSNGSTRVVQWGASGQPLNIPVAGDYDGDGKADIAVWHPGDGTWYIINSSNGSTRIVQWGASGQPYNIPVPADYDGDGKTDIAVWHPGDGTWYIMNSSNGSTRILQWGASGQPFNVPVPADYDGDGKADIAVWHPGDGTWFIINSSNGSTRIVQWGASGQPFNIPVPGDYDGDGNADIAVWNPGSGFWYITNSSNGSTTTMQWGSSPQPFSTPVPADYDGDGKTDIAVWHPGDGTWYIVNSSNGSTRIVQWGASGLPYNIPVPGR